MTDVLFINPGNQKKTYQELANEFTAITTPTWLCLLANYIRKHGYSAKIYDANIEGWDDKAPKKIIQKYQPKLIVMMVYGHHPSASTQTMPAAGKIAKDIKKLNKEILIAFGGTHPSVLAQKTIKEEHINFVIRGEGPDTILGIIKYLKGKEKIKNIPGLTYLENKLITNNYSAPLINNLDREFSDYAWDLLPGFNKYRAHNMHCFQDFHKSKKKDFSDVRSPYVAINTSLGCPYNCSFCCINGVFGKPGIRYWSLEKVVSWIDFLVKKGVKNIRIDDELFTMLPKRIEAFCDAIIDRNYDLNIWAYGRVDTINSLHLGKMKKAGINWICLGIESGNQRVRDSVNKGMIGNTSEIKKIVRRIQASGIYVLGNYMFGLPKDNLSTMNETYKLAYDLNCEFANFYSVMAYPGSDLYRIYSKKKNFLSDDWHSYSQHSYNSKPLPTKYLSSAEVLDFRDKAFFKYFTSEKYLNMIEKKFGDKVSNHIKRMTEIRIKRKIYDNK